jgi:23S rRNA-/tRNA-specific pseudouridylate synthase
LANGQMGETQTHAAGDLPLCLHAQRIVFTHPVSGERVQFESAMPAWAEDSYAARRPMS